MPSESTVHFNQTKLPASKYFFAFRINFYELDDRDSQTSLYVTAEYYALLNCKQYLFALHHHLNLIIHLLYDHLLCQLKYFFHVRRLHTQSCKFSQKKYKKNIFITVGIGKYSIIISSRNFIIFVKLCVIAKYSKT